MSFANETFGDQLTFASQARVDERADFIGKVYLHLGGAILAFAALTGFLLYTPYGEMVAQTVFGSGTVGMLIFFALFVAAGYLANYWVHSAVSPSLQYAGLGIYVVAQAIMFAPLLYVADRFFGPEIIPTAGVLTGVVFAALTAVVYITRYNFSFLGPGLAVASIAILGVFACSLIFGFNLASLGVWMPAGMVVFASLYILYDTSNILHTYRIGQHVAASLALFASVVLLFFWIVRLLMSLQRSE